MISSLLSKGRWDLSANAPARWIMVVPWALGFITYQLINPGGISWWVSVWTRLATEIHFTRESWMSASISSFVVAGAATFAIGAGRALARRRR